MWTVDTFGDWLLPILESGHSDLLCEFYGQSSLFQYMYITGNKICLEHNFFWQQHCFKDVNLIKLTLIRKLLPLSYLGCLLSFKWSEICIWEEHYQYLELKCYAINSLPWCITYLYCNCITNSTWHGINQWTCLYRPML